MLEKEKEKEDARFQIFDLWICSVRSAVVLQLCTEMKMSSWRGAEREQYPGFQS